MAGAAGFGDAGQGALIAAGVWEYAAARVEVGANGHPFANSLPSERFAGWVHGFGWLPDLLAAGEAGADAAARLCGAWADTYPARTANSFVFDPDRTARRLFEWGCVLDALERRPGGPVVQNYAAQMQRLRAGLRTLSPGLPEIRAAAAMVIYGARRADRLDAWLARGLDRLDTALDAQILPDGGHVSRSPETTADVLAIALRTDAVLGASGLSSSRALGRAIDRMAPMVQTLRHTDGGLGVFHGGSEGRPARLDAVIAAAPGQAETFSYGPQTGFHRLEAGDTVMLVDTLGVPPRPFDTGAHLAPLAVEMSTADGRLIVNCGFHAGATPKWRRPVRSAAAHSTLVLDERSPGEIVEDALRLSAFGPAVARDSGPVRARRKEQSSGIWLECAHDGYKDAYGLVHRRRLFVGEDGEDIRGEDSLYAPVGEPPLRRDQLPFTLRFHFHPDVRVSLAQDLSSALLVQRGRAGWRFRTDGGPLAVEPSVYLGGGAKPVRAQQLVITGQAYADGDGQGRDNRVRWSLRRLRRTAPPAATPPARSSS